MVWVNCIDICVFDFFLKQNVLFFCPVAQVFTLGSLLKKISVFYIKTIHSDGTTFLS